MAAQTIQEDLDLPDGSSPSDYVVTIELVGSGGAPIEGYHPATEKTIVGPLEVALDVDGGWAELLQANSEIVPAGTSYRRLIEGPGVRSRAFFSVPDAGGPYSLYDVLSAPPGTIPDGALADHESDLTLHGGGREIAYAEIQSPATVDTVDPSYEAITGMSITVPQVNRPVEIEAYLPAISLSIAAGKVSMAILPSSLILLQAVTVSAATFNASNDSRQLILKARLAPDFAETTWVVAGAVSVASTATIGATALQKPYIRAVQR